MTDASTRAYIYKEENERLCRGAITQLWDVFGLYPVHLTPRWQDGEVRLQVSIHLPRDYPRPEAHFHTFAQTWVAAHQGEPSTSMVINYVVD